MWKTKFQSVSFFCMTFRSLGLLEVCMMTHRAPLSPPSTTHEPWPLIQNMWVWDAVATATAVSTEAFARCPFSPSELFWVSLKVYNDDGGRRVWEKTCGGCIAGTQAGIYLKTGCMYLSGACWVKRVFVWVKKISPIFPRPSPPNHSSVTIQNPPTSLHLYVKLIQITDGHFI